MASKLYVGNLPYSIKDDGLRDLFAAHGNVESAVVISDKFSGQSKGFGFVEFSSDDEAQAAIKALDGHEVDGRRLKVSEARPQADRPPRDNRNSF